MISDIFAFAKDLQCSNDNVSQSVLVCFSKAQMEVDSQVVYDHNKLSLLFTSLTKLI